MKKLTVLLFLLCTQAACIPMPVDSEISACPSNGLAFVTFMTGMPPGGTIIPSKPGENGEMTWDLRSAGADVYISCHYAGSTTDRIQKLPGEMRSCRLTVGGNLSCKSYI